jgi:pyrimidine deaminase RibD-like protein
LVQRRDHQRLQDAIKNTLDFDVEELLALVRKERALAIDRVATKLQATKPEQGTPNGVDREFMEKAVAEARKSRTEDGRVHPKVGVVVVKDGKELAVAYRGELGKGDHAEFTALEKKLADVEIAGATVYTTLEPCTTRKHPKRPCAVRLNDRKVTGFATGAVKQTSPKTTARHPRKGSGPGESQRSPRLRSRKVLVDTP